MTEEKKTPNGVTRTDGTNHGEEEVIILVRAGESPRPSRRMRRACEVLGIPAPAQKASTAP